jgi:hypothetical protein
MPTLDPSDPLSGSDVYRPRNPKRLPRIGGDGFARTRWGSLADRANDDVFPQQITRLCLHLQMCTLEGQRPGVVMNRSLEELGISRWQKYRLMKKLEVSGRISIEQRPGCHPVVAILRPWW